MTKFVSSVMKAATAELLHLAFESARRDACFPALSWYNWVELEPPISRTFR